MAYSAKWRRRDSGIVLFKASPASLPSGSTFTRSTTATYVDTNGVYQTAGANALRSGHYIGGVQTILLEGSRTNSVLWSRDLTNAAWTSGGTGTTTQNAVGLDGTANSATTLTDSDAAASRFNQQTLTVPVDSNTHTTSYWVKKDTDTTRFPLLYSRINGGTQVSRSVMLNTQTGAATVSDVVGTGTTRVVDGGLWWIVEITLTNNSTALNTNLATTVYPAYGTVLGTPSVAATGSCVVGQVQVELNSPFYSSPIFTTTAAVNRGADLLYLPISFTPQALTIYAKVINLGTFATTAAQRVFQIGSNSAGSFNVKAGASNTVVPEVNNGGFVSGVGVGSVQLSDVLETKSTLTPAGVWGLTATVNNGTESAQTTAAYGSMPATFSTPVIYVGSDGATSGFAAFQSVKIAAGIQPLATMRTL